MNIFSNIEGGESHEEEKKKKNYHKPNICNIRSTYEKYKAI